MGVIATLLPQPARLQLVSVDLYATGEANFEAVRELRQGMPRLTIIAYSTLSLERVRDVFDAGRAGVDSLVMPDEDDTPRELLALIEGAESRSLGSVVRRSLDEVDRSVRDAVLLAITRAHEHLSPAGLAQLLALPRRTVSQRLDTAGF